MKRSFLLHGFTALSTAVFLLLQFFDPAVIREHVETETYDLRLYAKNALKGPLGMDAPARGDIAIVAVDEKSVAEVGRWPWSRRVMADLVRRVSAGGPRAIGIDVLFTEPEGEEADRDLAAALEETGNAVLATGYIVVTSGEKPPKPNTDYLWEHAFMSVKSTEAIDWKGWLVQPDSVLAPLEEFAASSALGSVYYQPDRDGVLRWEILYVLYDEDFYPSLALQVARVAKGLGMEQMELQGGSGVRLGGEFIPTDLSGRALIDYLGSEGSFPYVSAIDVLEGRTAPDAFEGKIVLIGATAIATYDQKITPLSTNMPGIEKNATVVENILDGRFIRKSPGLIEMVITLVTAIVLSAFLGRVRALPGTGLWLTLVAFYVLLAFYLFIYELLWITLIYPVLNMFSIFIFQTTAKFFFEERRAKEVRRMFSQYVSPAVVEALIANPDMARLGGQRKEVTVLFSDIAGFTSISEKLQPEEVVALLNEYFKAMTDIIFKWRGTFDKIVGDEIMAFWGAPVEQPDHAELATRCALDMQKTLVKLREKWASESKPSFSCGIGMNTGEVLVGNIGAEDKKMDYTVIGDHVNAAARVEGLTREFKAKILVTENTAKRLQVLLDAKKFGHVELQFRGHVKVKGKVQELGIFEVVDTEA